MTYEFVRENGKYQLVYSRWYWPWNRRYDVYLEENAMKRFILSAKDKKGSGSSTHQTTIEASRLVSILKNLGIERSDLINTKFPIEANSKMIDQWAYIINWLSAYQK